MVESIKLKGKRCPKNYVRTRPGSDRCRPSGRFRGGGDSYELPEWRRKCGKGYRRMPKGSRTCRRAPKQQQKRNDLVEKMMIVS